MEQVQFRISIAGGPGEVALEGLVNGLRSVDGIADDGGAYAVGQGLREALAQGKGVACLGSYAAINPLQLSRIRNGT